MSDVSDVLSPTLLKWLTGRLVTAAAATSFTANWLQDPTLPPFRQTPQNHSGTDVNATVDSFNHVLPDPNTLPYCAGPDSVWKRFSQVLAMKADTYSVLPTILHMNTFHGNSFEVQVTLCGESTYNIIYHNININYRWRLNFNKSIFGSMYVLVSQLNMWVSHWLTLCECWGGGLRSSGGRRIVIFREMFILDNHRCRSWGSHGGGAHKQRATTRNAMEPTHFFFWMLSFPATEYGGKSALKAVQSQTARTPNLPHRNLRYSQTC